MVLSIVRVQAQTVQNNFSLYVCMLGIDSQGQKFLNNNHIKQVALFDARYLDPTNSMSLNTITLTKAIKAAFPDPSSSGTAALDWEGDMLSNLRKDSSSDEFKKSMTEFSEAIHLAKSLRPNVKWGFYYLPFTTYWKRNDQWKASNIQIEGLLKQCDILFPSLYIFYKEGSNGPGDNESYASENIYPILKLAKDLNKPVLPFIWHRYHDSNRDIGLQLIPLNDFRSFVNKLLSANYQGKRVSGLVWWGADPYFYRVKSKALMAEMQASNSTDFNTHMDSLLVNYSNVILNAMKKNR
jgi:hypothetical protein